MLRLTCLLACIIIIFSYCNDSATTTDNTMSDTATADKNTASVKDSSEFNYDPAMEPMTVGAKFVKKLHDTLNVKLYEFTIKPGDSAALHKHPDHIVYVLQGGKLEISLNGGAKQIMDLQPGVGFVSPAVSDSGKNIGKTTIKLVVADIYRPRQ